MLFLFQLDKFFGHFLFSSVCRKAALKTSLQTEN
jgi:hypothetical protein